MQTDNKEGVPGRGPETPAAGVEARPNRQSHYTPNLNESHTLTLREQAALEWLKRDFMLVPVQPNSKKLVAGFGFYQDKITNPEGVGHWFGERSLSNLAVCATQTSLILDFDDAELYKFWAGKFPDAARTYTEQTPRGGCHVFAHVWGESLKGFMPIKGVELKRVVVVYPSMVDGKRYTQGAGDLLDLDADQILSPLKQFPTTKNPPHYDRNGKGYLPKIKATYSCLDLIQSSNPKVKVYGSAKRFVTVPCPFHDDKEPSFWIDTERNLWGCHACGTRGDVINLYARLKGLTNLQAIREMAVTP
jgi:hypothetical protein